MSLYLCNNWIVKMKKSVLILLKTSKNKTFCENVMLVDLNEGYDKTY